MRTRILRLSLVFLLCVGVGYAGAQAISGRASARNVLASAWQRVSGSAAAPAPAGNLVAAPASSSTSNPAHGSSPDSSAIVAQGPVGILSPDVPVVDATGPATVGELANPDILPISTPVRADGSPVYREPTRSAPQSSSQSREVVRRQSVATGEPQEREPEPVAQRAAPRAELIQLEQQLSELSGRFTALTEFYAKMERTVERNGGTLRTEVVTRLSTGTSAVRNAEDALADGDVSRLRANLATLSSAVRYLDAAKSQ